MAVVIVIGFKYKDDKLLPYTYIDLEKVNQYLRYPWERIIITDFAFKDAIPYTYYKEFTLLLEDKIRDRKRIFFFYSGHALDTHRLLLPDDTILESGELTQIFSLADPEARILSFFDCCYGFNLSLPFILNSSIDKESNSKNMKCDVSKRFLRQNIISVTSSNPGQPGRMIKTGSTFTDRLVGIDLKKIVRWDLMDFNICSSFPDLLFNY